MKGSIFTQCCSFTNKIKNDPLASLFLEPVRNSLTDLQYAEYLQIVERPMDLTTLYRNLKEHTYSNVKDWFDDFRLIFDNALKYNLPDSYVSGISRFFKKKLEKFYQGISFDGSYTQRLNLLYSNYLEVLSHPPKNCNIKIDIKPIEKIEKGYEESSLAILADKLNTICAKGNYNAKLESILGTDLTKIDVGMLSESKISSLWDFVRRYE